jgi:hypothetical protein
MEARRIGRVDHAGDVQHRVGAVDQRRQRGAVGKVAADPFDARARRLLASRQRAQRHALAAGFVDHRSARRSPVPPV